MSQEILYTSAPQGLKPGSRGFCTVASTAGIAKNLLERLESFSGYRHAFMAHEAQAAQNPVNYAHYHTTVGGRKYHILSRVADAGLDYTQRSNKLAHHVALEPSETENAPGGPAWVMATPGFFVDQWDGQVRTWPVGREPPASERPTRGCQRWQTLTGDAGWGGVLAESALRKGSLMSVIFPAGTPVLELVVESLSLLPQEKRWDVTFSTYFTKAPAGVDCQWRFLLDGTPEATALRRDVRAAVIDLCQPLGQAQGGELVQAARSQAVAPRSRTSSPESLRRTAAETLRPAVAAPQQRADEPKELKLAPPSPTKATRPASPVPAWLTRPKASVCNRWRTIALTLGLAGIVVAAVGAGLLSVPRDVAIVHVPSSSPDQHVTSSAPMSGLEAGRAETSLPPEDSPPSVEPYAEGTPMQSDESLAKTLPEKERGQIEPTPKPEPFADLISRHNRLRLPPVTVTEGTSTTFRKQVPNTAIERLARVDLESAQACQLEVFGREWESKGGRISQTDKDGIRWWELRMPQSAILKDEIPIATFTLDNGELQFKWGGIPRPQSESKEPRVFLPPPVRLVFCSIRLNVGNETATCTFEPELELSPPAELQFDGRATYRVDLTKGRDYFLRSNDALTLELQIDGLDGAMLKDNRARLPLSDAWTTLSVDPRTAILLQVRLVLDEQYNPIMEGKLVGTVLELKPPPSQSADLLASTPGWTELNSELDLSDTSIEEHRRRHKEYLQRKIISVRRNDFVEIDKWKEENSEVRKNAVAYAKDRIEFDRLRLTNASNEELEKKAKDLISKPKSELSARLFRDCRLVQNLPLAEQYNSFADAWEKVDAWCTAALAVKKELGNKGQLNYRLSIDVDGRKMTLAATKDFRDASSPPVETK